MSFLDLAIVLLYIAAMFAIGVRSSGYIRTFVDFTLAGRRLTTPLLIGTLVATYCGLDVTFGSSETAYLEGLSTFFVYSLPFYLAYVTLALLLAPRIAALNVQSLPEACAHLYGPSVRIPVACATTLYSLPILSVAGLGVVGHFFFGWDPLVAGFIGACIAATYTVLGGLLADTLTDMLQFATMCITLTLATVIGVTEIGSWATLRESLAPTHLEPLGALSVTDIIIYSAIALSPLVDPAFYQRIFAAESVATVQRALLWSTVFWAAIDWSIVYLGLLGQHLVNEGVIASTIDATEILLHVTATLLPTGLLGLFVAGIIATAMSTVDSYALIAASSVVYDGWHAFRKQGFTESQLILFTRIGIVVMVVSALLISFLFERFRDAWIFMASILVSSTLVPILAGLLGPRPRRRAGVWSCWSGFLSSIGLFVLFETVGAYDPIQETQVLAVPATALTFQREHLLLVTVPIAFAAFAAGAWSSKAEESSWKP